MNRRRKSARRVGEEIANVGATLLGNRNSPQVQVVASDQVPVNPLAMTDGEARKTLFHMEKSITTQDRAITAQANRDVVPRENQHASTMASCLRDFVKMNPPMYFGSKVNEDPQDFLHEVYKILFAMRFEYY